jgi:hypothetical protein
MGTEFVWDDENILEMDLGNDCTTFWMNILTVTELYT